MKTDTLKAIVLSEIPSIADLTKDKVIEIIRDYIECDKELLYKQFLGRKADRVMGSIRDEKGVRIYLSNGAGRYINVETSEDVIDLTNVEKQLFIKLKGLSKSYKKTIDRKKTVSDQITMFDEEPISSETQ